MQVTRYSDDVMQAQRTHDGIMHQSLTRRRAQYWRTKRNVEF